MNHNLDKTSIQCQHFCNVMHKMLAYYQNLIDIRAEQRGTFCDQMSVLFFSIKIWEIFLTLRPSEMTF